MGPAIIDQLDATTVIPPGHTARVDEFKNILIGEFSSPVYGGEPAPDLIGGGRRPEGAS
jgi:hypothetical protein